jgi:hypothetical protein
MANNNFQPKLLLSSKISSFQPFLKPSPGPGKFPRQVNSTPAVHLKVAAPWTGALVLNGYGSRIHQSEEHIRHPGIDREEHLVRGGGA